MKRYISEEKWVLGRLLLPNDFLNTSPGDGEQKHHIEAAFESIAPLILHFDDERKLARSQFTSLINMRAEELGVSSVTLRRILLRFYYFGRLKAALLPLRSGRNSGDQRPISNYEEWTGDNFSSLPKRRGRQPIEAAVLGRNEFVASLEDVQDMTECLNALAAKGKTTMVAAHKKYIKEYFSQRNPSVYARFAEEKHPLPVTLRQFRSVIKNSLSFERHVRENTAGLEKGQKKGRSLARGPGEIYEIDATGGRIFVVDSRPPYAVLGTPIIYIVIDRWSRFIPGIYVTLRPASWEEIRYALLISFTSRKKRFRNLGINVDEARWPQGRVCARLVMDRGSEMLSQAMLEAAVNDLQIETEVMPPLCPDGKGVVERVIRELKRVMAQRKIRGSFAERPLDPKTKRAFKASRKAAIHNLQELYWALIDIVDQHNNSPHSHLESLSILRRARVRPTPREAYEWGLKNITGIESPPLADSDYERLLLGHDEASLANGTLMFRSRRYYPVNAAAERQSRLSTTRRHRVKVRVDRSDPSELFAPNGDDDWPRWQVDDAGLIDLRETTMEEQDELSGAQKLLIAQTRNSAFISEQERAPLLPRKKASTQPSGVSSHHEIKQRRIQETNRVKHALSGNETPNQVAKPTQPDETQALSWEDIERIDQANIVDRQRRRRIK